MTHAPSQCVSLQTLVTLQTLGCNFNLTCLTYTCLCPQQQLVDWSAKPLQPSTLGCNPGFVCSATHMCMLPAELGRPNVVDLDLRCNSALICSATHMCVPAAADGRPNLCNCWSLGETLSFSTLQHTCVYLQQLPVGRILVTFRPLGAALI